jgi:hypothetical protein
MSTNEKMDWKKFVSESNGRAVFLPEEFRKQMDKIEEARKALNKKLTAMAKEEITLTQMGNEMYFKFREYMEKNGYEDIWHKEISLNVDAREAGFYVLHIQDGQSKTL